MSRVGCAHVETGLIRASAVRNAASSINSEVTDHCRTSEVWCKMEFTYDSYRMLLSSLKTSGYECRKFDAETALGGATRRIVRLRHDVDIDVLGVDAMASSEEESGFYSTWFFLFDSPLYNIYSAEMMDIVARLTSNGHTVGLHVDAARYTSFEQMQNAINSSFNNFNLIALACGYPGNMVSKVFSFHRPAQWLLNQNVVIDGWVNAYRDDFFGFSEKVVYISDSNRREFWKEDRLPFALENGRTITLLTHPSWWHNSSLDSDETFEYLTKSLGSERVGQIVSATAKRYADKYHGRGDRC